MTSSEAIVPVSHVPTSLQCNITVGFNIPLDTLWIISETSCLHLTGAETDLRNQ